MLRNKACLKAFFICLAGPWQAGTGYAPLLTHEKLRAAPDSFYVLYEAPDSFYTLCEAEAGQSQAQACFASGRCATAKARAGANYVPAPRWYTARFYSAMDYFAGMFSPRVMEDPKDLALKYFKLAKKNEKRPGKYKRSMGDAEVRSYARMRKAMLEREKREKEEGG